mmetsp:Transcript_9045/g.33347  ORF Transcript_9045/g.33347 Transcript_9045/m.33347 type:complete len:116 (+) Transcript_9045:802-1149(+)
MIQTINIPNNNAGDIVITSVQTASPSTFQSLYAANRSIVPAEELHFGASSVVFRVLFVHIRHGGGGRPLSVWLHLKKWKLWKSVWRLCAAMRALYYSFVAFVSVQHVRLMMILWK